MKVRPSSLDVSDERRRTIRQALGHRGGLATRKDVIAMADGRPQRLRKALY